MIRTIRNDFKWPGWAAAIDSFVSSCESCQKHKTAGVKNYGKLPMKDEKQEEL